MELWESARGAGDFLESMHDVNQRDRRQANSSADSSKARRDDPVSWVRHYWARDDLGEGEDAYLAMSSVLRFSRVLAANIERELSDVNLNLTDYLLLMTLKMSEHGERLISALARNLMVHPTTATLATDRLESRGFLVRMPHPTDRRAILVRLTDSGEALALEATDRLRQIEFGLIGSTSKERASITSLLTTLRERAGD